MVFPVHALNDTDEEAVETVAALTIMERVCATDVNWLHVWYTFDRLGTTTEEAQTAFEEVILAQSEAARADASYCATRTEDLAEFISQDQ